MADNLFLSKLQAVFAVTSFNCCSGTDCQWSSPCSCSLVETEIQEVCLDSHSDSRQYQHFRSKIKTAKGIKYWFLWQETSSHPSVNVYVQWVFHFASPPVLLCLFAASTNCFIFHLQLHCFDQLLLLSLASFWNENVWSYFVNIPAVFSNIIMQQPNQSCWPIQELYITADMLIV